MSDELILHCPKCPRDKTPKLYVNVDKGVFNCFRCDWHGKIKELYKFPELISTLEDRISLSEFSKLKSFKPLDLSNIDILEDLNPVRELYYQDPQYDYLLKRGWNDELISTYKPLISMNEKYKNRVILPVVKDEKIIYWTARSIEPNPIMKYKNPSIPRNDVIFESLIHENIFFPEIMIICEGLFDAYKIPNSIALFGKTITSENEINIIKKASNKKTIYVCLDQGAESNIQTICSKLQSWFPNKQIYYINTSSYGEKDLGNLSEELTSFELINFIQTNSLIYSSPTLLSNLQSKLIKFI